jgi:hypothetical protein
MLDSLVRVSRRAAYNHYASVRAEARSSVWADCMALPAIRRPGGRYIPRAFNQPPKPTLARQGRSEPVQVPVEPPQASLVASASLSTISRAVSLSFQSAFHLSITLLVRYRSPANI